MNPETFYFKLTVASPLHIGCDDVYEPTGFVVDQQNKALISFQPIHFLEQLTSEELKKYSAICRRGTLDSIQDLYKFMRQYKDLATGNRVTISPDFARHYEDVLNKSKDQFKKELNNLVINRTAYNPIENYAIIPGSAIKGAIRTAVLNARNSKTKTQQQYSGQNGNLELQENLLQYSFKTVGTDPFRLIKVSDFIPLKTVQQQICYAVNIRKKHSSKRPSFMAQMQEIIEPASTFFGSITVIGAPPAIRKPVNMPEIINAMKQFFGSEKQREDRELQGINIPPGQPSGTSNIPLRLGRHSGAESVTIAGHRHIKIMTGKDKKQNYSTTGASTFWLNSPNRKPSNYASLQPMGWVELDPLPQKEVEAIQMAMDTAQQQKQQQHIFDEQWQKMSELDQDITIIKNADIAHSQNHQRNPLADIWPKLETLDTETQVKLAKAFFQRWQKDPKKWRQKKCSEKQWEKIKFLIDILDIAHPDLVQKTTTEPPTDHADTLQTIIKLKTFTEYQQNKEIKITKLDRTCAKALKERFSAFKCRNATKRSPEAKAWKKLTKQLREMR